MNRGDILPDAPNALEGDRYDSLMNLQTVASEGNRQSTCEHLDTKQWLLPVETLTV